MNVFVFPTRNEPGLEIIQALRKSNKIRLFGGSSYDARFDPARHILENYVTCPGFDEPSFKEDFLGIIRRLKIDVVFPAWDPLVAMFSEWREPGVAFVTPRPEIARMFLSKTATYNALKGVIPTPVLYDEANAPLPLFAKPDRDSGSRNTMHVQTAHEFELAKSKRLLLCEYLPGREFTVDCISDLRGNLLFSQARHRGRINQGIALGTEAMEHGLIAEYIRRIASTLRIEGPWFAQFRENAKGAPVLMEINARVAGSMTLARLSGVNIPLIAAFMFSGEEVRVPVPKKAVLINRHLRTYGECGGFDFAIWDWDDTIIRKDKKPDPDAVACLVDLHNRGVRQVLLTKNKDTKSLAQKLHIPDLFIEHRCVEDKAEGVAAILETYRVNPERCVMINDSYAEIFLLQDKFPGMNFVTPDALDLLGREKTQ